MFYCWTDIIGISTGKDGEICPNQSVSVYPTLCTTCCSISYRGLPFLSLSLFVLGGMVGITGLCILFCLNTKTQNSFFLRYEPLLPNFLMLDRGPLPFRSGFLQVMQQKFSSSNSASNRGRDNDGKYITQKPSSCFPISLLFHCCHSSAPLCS